MCKAIVVANQKDTAKSELEGLLTQRGVNVIAWVRLDEYINGGVFIEDAATADVVILNTVGVNGAAPRDAVMRVASPTEVVHVEAQAKRKGGPAPKLNLLDAWLHRRKRPAPPPIIPRVQRKVVEAVEVSEVDHRPPPTAIVKVPFRDSHIDAVKDERGIWAGIKRMCEDVGLGYSSQLQKLKDADWSVMTMIVTTGPDGKHYEMSMLRADCIPMWMANINSSKVAPEIRPAIEAYQLKARDVLAAYFTPVAAHAAGVDVEAIGAALMQTGKELKQLRSEVEDLRFTIGILKPKMPTWTEPVPLETTVQDVYDAIEACAERALDRLKVSNEAKRVIGLLRLKEHVNGLARKAVIKKKDVSGRLNKLDAYTWRAIINVCNEPQIEEAAAVWFRERHHALLAA